MVEFFIQDYSETDVFIYVSPDVNYSWYRIYVRETVSGAEVFSSWFNYTVGFSWSVDGLQPGTSYTVNVQYNNTGQGGGGSWAGAKSFTTLGAVQETRYAMLAYNANGGSGAPGPQYGEGTDQYLRFTVSYTTPTRMGYVFQGWSLDAAATSPSYGPGSSISIWTTTTYPGPTTTLYAVWSKDTSGGAYIGKTHAAVYIFDDGWIKAVPYVRDGGAWKKGI